MASRLRHTHRSTAGTSGGTSDLRAFLKGLVQEGWARNASSSHLPNLVDRYIYLSTKLQIRLQKAPLPPRPAGPESGWFQPVYLH